ncbi:ABC-type Fe3+/spermidine/putrescine transport system ATPase subunit [Methanolinea mesophila]|uniref:ABC transporter ATP-binding protein n=1 Tax=Methanolinea mesophila TaxID=547055 RepID=UPI001AE4B001|nr:ABC transporter ATP-binding protein [Methanolinea mesophila]MBP1928161.1 ABC-type Fe3+/spermidine/putrescine transport system ATPase subunit [Methanolinea mesophila]
MIGLEGISVTFGRFAVRDVDLSVNPGEYFFLMGPSGAGKTVLLETIAGLHAPDRGAVRVGPGEVTRLPPEARRIGFVYQDYSLFPHYTVEENVGFGMKMTGVPLAARKERTEELLARFGILPLRDRLPGTLSGGEQQRVALARALAPGPSVLLLDEPFAALDAGSRDRCMKELRSLHRESGLTILQVSHSRDEAYALADRVAVMDQGRIVQTGTRKEVFESPSHPASATIAGYENMIPGVVVGAGDGIAVMAGDLTIRGEGNVRPGDRALACIRAARIKLISPSGLPGEDEIRVRGTISSLIPGDSSTKVGITGPVDLQALVPLEDPPGLVIGSPVTVAFSPDDVHIVRVSDTGRKER